MVGAQRFHYFSIESCALLPSGIQKVRVETPFTGALQARRGGDVTDHAANLAGEFPGHYVFRDGRKVGAAARKKDAKDELLVHEGFGLGVSGFEFQVSGLENEREKKL